MPDKKAEQAEKMRAWRAKRRALGLPTSKSATDEQRKKKREAIALRRAEAKARGEKTPSETWWERNRNRHRERVAGWRAENLERSRELSRNNQKTRRSTPWGTINNRLWPTMHYGVRANSTRPGIYTAHIGYTWADLRTHLEAQFTPGMTWDNWGDVWEVDHIVPVSSFKYTSIDDALFKEAWKLSNLRPLTVGENMAKGIRLMAA